MAGAAGNGRPGRGTTGTGPSPRRCRPGSGRCRWRCRLALTPEDLGMRITYLASALGTGEPYRDMAVPFAVER
jgi:hypothetical protein